MTAPGSHTWTEIRIWLSFLGPYILSSLSLPGKQSTVIQQYPNGWHSVVLSFIKEIHVGSLCHFWHRIPKPLEFPK